MKRLPLLLPFLILSCGISYTVVPRTVDGTVVDKQKREGYYHTEIQVRLGYDGDTHLVPVTVYEPARFTTTFSASDFRLSSSSEAVYDQFSLGDPAKLTYNEIWKVVEKTEEHTLIRRDLTGVEPKKEME